MSKVFWVGNNEPPDGLEDFEVVRTSEEEALKAVERSSGSDSVVVLSGATHEKADDFFASVRETAPDVPCILVGEAQPVLSKARGGENGVVLDYVVSEGSKERVADVIRSAVERRSHTSYPVPEEENARLEQAEVYDDVGTEGEFDRLTEIAQKHFDADMAFVGIVGENCERFLSCHGASAEEIPREETICTYQILEEGVVVINNILEDPRFEMNETLRRMGMRFYAGAALNTPSGAKIGSFCVFHTETRDFDDDDKDFLTLLADEAMDKLELLRGRR